MTKLTQLKLGLILLFCALFLGVFFACEKTELEIVDSIELEDNAMTQNKIISVDGEYLRSDMKPPAIRVP